MNGKPQHSSGYTSAVTEAIRSVCLSVAVALGDHLDHCVVVGGLVPTLLSEGGYLDYPADTDRHVGTTDLDLGLSLSVLDDERYAAISELLRGQGFGPDENARGNPTRQRWSRGELEIDFLIPVGDAGTSGSIQNLEADFAALKTRGLELAFVERLTVDLEGRTLNDDMARRSVGVCGPAAFVVLKAFALAGRDEPKDAYDLVHVIRFAEGGADRIAAGLQTHAVEHAATVDAAIACLAEEFATIQHRGPQMVARFSTADPSDLDVAAADAHGFVDDLVRAYRSLLSPPPSTP